MECVSPVSSVPCNYIYEQILSPLALALPLGLYDDYYGLGMGMLEFAKKNGLLPYDQTLAGQYIDYLVSFEDLPEDHPDSLAAQAVIDQIFDLYDSFGIINETAASGGYITPITTRDDGNVAQVNLASFATGHLKDVVAAITTIDNVDIIDLGAGSGSILQTFMKYDNVSFKSYTNVDIDPTTGHERFMDTVKNFRYLMSDRSIPTPPIKHIHTDANTHVREAYDSKALYMAIHSYYYLDPDVRDILKKTSFAGVAHFTDLLFDQSNVAVDLDMNIVLQGDYIGGKIGKYNILKELVVFLTEVGPFYPARFFSSLRKPCLDNPAIGKSLAMWSPNLKFHNTDVLPFAGKEFELIPVNGGASYRRTKIYELDDTDFCMLRMTGYFISAKIDGIMGFLSFESGVYVLTFRDKSQYLIRDPFEKPVNFGFTMGSINVEVVFNFKTGHYQLWFVSVSPAPYPDDAHNRRLFWRAIFQPFSAQLEIAKRTYAGLFFKPYYWVPPFETRRGSLDIYRLLRDTGVPADGVVFHDPYSNFVGYWKPWRTADVYVSREPYGLVAFAHARDWPVDDPKCRFISNGVYEVVAADGKLRIIHSRMDKDRTGDVPLEHRNQLFDYSPVDGKLVVDNVLINFVKYTLTDYLENYGRVYSKIVSNLIRLHLSPDDAKVAYDLVRAYLMQFATVLDVRVLFGVEPPAVPNVFLVSDFVAAVVSRTGFDPKRLWSSLVHHGFIQKISDHTNPEIVRVGVDLKAVIRFN